MKTKLTLLLFIVISFICKPTTSRAQVNVQDSMALVDLYNSCDGVHWTTHTNWLTANPVSTWDGITTNAGRVTEIRLSYNNISGAIPNSLGDLSNLQILSLSGNQLARVPSSLGNLSNLQSLSLDQNQLTRVPASFGNLARLRYLSLGRNQLTTLPVSLGKLDSHISLGLSDNHLSGHFPWRLRKVHSYIYGNNYTFDAGERILARKNIHSSPEAPIPLHLNGNTLSVYAGGTLSNNTYTWHKGNKHNVVATITGDSTYEPDSSGFYFVSITNAIVGNNLTLFSDTIHFTAAPKQANAVAAKNNTGVSDKENSFSIYPIPAKDVLHVDFGAIKSTVAAVQIISDEGKIIAEKFLGENKNTQVDISPFSPGTYFIVIKTKTETLSKKFIKE